MFSFLKSQKSTTNSKTLTLKLRGLHCSSCAVNIDLTLEDLPGIIESKTNYQKSLAEISYDPQIVTPQEIIHTINSLGYSTE